MDDVISFAVGEPGCEAAPHVVAEGQRAFDTPAMHYTHVNGIPALREEIANYSSAVKGLTYDADTETQVTHGATAALMLTFLTLVDPGDEVIIASPYFTAYEAQILAAGGTPVVVALRQENSFHHNAADIAAAITDRTTAIVLNSPGNPTGAVTPLADLEEIAKVAIDNDLWVISDEVYHRFVYTGEAVVSIATLPGMFERTVVIDSFSKTYAMTGWRVGYLHGPAEFVAETSSLAEPMTSSNNSASQFAAVAALTGPQDLVDTMRTTYDANRKLVGDIIATAPMLKLAPSEGAFYAFVDVTGTGLSSHEFATQLIEQEHVAVVPGDAFGSAGEGYVRLSYVGTPEDTREGVQRMVDFAVRTAGVQA